MKVNEFSYAYWVCPHCGCKHTEKVSLIKLPSGGVPCSGYINPTGYLCQKCDRYFTSPKRFIDRKEIRRDIERLRKYLEKAKA